MQAVLEEVGWQMAKWHHEHDVAPTVTPFDWVEVLQEVVTDFPRDPIPLADLRDCIGHLAAVSLIVLGQLPRPDAIDGSSEARPCGDPTA